MIVRKDSALTSDVEDLSPDPIDGEIVLSGDAPASGRLNTTPVSVHRQRHYLRYLAVPVLFLIVTLLGGMRFDGADASFVFIKPALAYLIFSTLLLLIYFRSGLLAVHGWFNEDFPVLKNVANAAVLVTLFGASTQIFNSLTPEQGLPFWVISFCFLWTLWNDLFADFDPKKLLRSLGGLFGFAFAVKYLLLANLTAPAGQGWLRSIIENPAQQTMTWLLDLPQFSAATGYLQFIVVGLYLLGLYLLPTTTNDR
jgi:hypothetical protein